MGRRPTAALPETRAGHSHRPAGSPGRVSFLIGRHAHGAINAARAGRSNLLSPVRFSPGWPRVGRRALPIPLPSTR